MHRALLALVLTLVAFGCALREPPAAPPPPPTATPIAEVPSNGPIDRPLPVSEAPLEIPAPAKDATVDARKNKEAEKAPVTTREDDSPIAPESPAPISGDNRAKPSQGGGEIPAHTVPSAATVNGGIPREVLERAVLAHFLELRTCYQALLEKNPDAKGMLKVDFTVGPKGDVSNARVKLTPDSSDSAQCVLRVVQKLQFPPADKASDVHLAYPFTLKPGS